MKLVTTTGFLSGKFGDLRAVEIIKNVGFDAYDYNMAHLESREEFMADSHWDKIKALKKKADRIGIECTQAHAPMIYDESIILPITVRSMEYAAYLGAEIIVVHPMTDNLGYYEHKNELFEKNMEMYKKLIPHAERLNIKIAVENMFGWDKDRMHNLENTCSHSEEFAKYVDAQNSEYIVACVDIGHAQLVHEAPETLLANLGKRVRAIHVHDNTGFDDAHNIPYSGTINWDNVCSTLYAMGYTGNFTFEADMFFSQYMDDEMILHAVKYLEQVGRSLIRKIK